MLTRTREELESDLRELIAKRRIPPSEVDDMWRNHELRVAAIAAGELDEDGLREELVSTIQIYRKSFERKRASDDLPLARLEQRFMTMATAEALGDDDRRARIDAIYGAYDARALTDADRIYYKQLALAKLVREHASKAPQAKEGDSLPTPELGEGGLAGEPRPEEGSSAGAALPSIDGL